MRTFRIYSAGVTDAAISQRLRGLAVLLYLLGLSYGAVALSALGYPWSKTSVYDAVQAAAARARAASWSGLQWGTNPITGGRPDEWTL